jgi:hypothetical protein
VAYVVPIDPDTGRLNAKKWTGGKAVLSKMQTNFANQVGQAHQMHRGIEGSKARHQTIQKFYGRIKQPSEHFKISPETAAPQVLNKGFFSTEYETPEVVAQRLTQSIQRAYAPAVETAKLVESERLRAQEMARTAQAKDTELKKAEERFNNLARTLQPFIQLGQLDREEFMLLAKTVSDQVNLLRKKREFITERQRRVDQLPKLEQKSAGASLTLATHAIAALDLVNGDPAKVNWDQVERAAALEAIQLNHQSRESVLQAIVKHSPGMADSTRRDAASKLIQAIPQPEPHLAPVRTVSKKREGPDFSR